MKAVISSFKLVILKRSQLAEGVNSCSS